MELTMLGTGNAHATAVYNTCYVLRENGDAENGRCFLVDGGGGNQILTQLERAGIRFLDCQEMFLTHKHIDHLFGIIWMVRKFAQAMLSGQYEGDMTLYGHDEGIRLVREISRSLLQPKQAGLLGGEQTGRIHLVCVSDSETRQVMGHEMTFFDIGSAKTKQFGYVLTLPDGERLCCCGDEPCSDRKESYARGAKWLLHEAFCLFADRERFRPYEKNHTMVKDVAQLAERLEVANLLLYHTEDSDIPHRKMRYTAEAAAYYRGNIFVPEDLEVITL
jgi:ribonuclease Z